MQEKVREIQRHLDRALEENRELRLAKMNQPKIDMPSLNKPSEQDKEKMEEELTLFKNQDRVIREKCTQLEM